MTRVNAGGFGKCYWLVAVAGESAMSDLHPNVALISKVDPRDLTANPGLFSPDVVFHYVNPNLPDLEGSYHGVEGIREFFGVLGKLTKGTFVVEPVSVTPIGDELLAVHTCNRLTFQGNPLEIDTLTVWRIVGGRITEIWDIPSTQPRSASA